MNTSRRLNGKNCVGLLVATLLAAAAIMASMRVWEMDFTVPVSFSGDGILGDLLHKSVKQYGIKGLWYCYSIGAPEYSALIDTPFLDLAYGLEVYLISLVAPANAISFVLYILTYPLAAFTIYLLLNRFTDSVPLKLMLSAAFAVTPYHFMRNMGHLTLSQYHVVAIAVYLMLVIYEEDFAGVVPRRYLSEKWKILLLYGGCVYLGMSNIYYVFFGLVCMGMALVAKLIKSKRLSCLWKEAAPIYAVLVGVLIGLAPKLYYTLRYGPNEGALVRNPVEAEMFALKIIQMLLPAGYNRVGRLAALSEVYNSNAINLNENACSTLGLIGSLGFLLACGWVIWRLVKAEPRDKLFNARMGIITLAILCLVLYCMGGGFGAIVNYYIFREIRALNRSSIVIECLSLCVVCLYVDLFLRQRESQRRRICTGVAVLAAGALVMFTEFPVNSRGWQDYVKAEDKRLHQFFDAVEADAGEGAMIYQLPFMVFPEAAISIVNMQDYEPALGYVYSDSLRWSYGGMKGRNDAAKRLFIDNGMSPLFVRRIQEAGFTGVYIDIDGYENDGEEIIAFYSDTLGLTPIVSEDERLYYYNVSGVTIADEDLYLTGYYDFLKRFSDENGASADDKALKSLARGLENGDENALDTLWSWAQESDSADLSSMDSAEYVLYLYNNLLDRDETQPQGWAARIDGGDLTRREVFDAFVKSDEFKLLRGAEP